MFAELVINIEAPLAETYHYHVSPDLQDKLATGHMVQVEFGRRLAQGIVLALTDTSPVEETKPVISLIDEKPVVLPWQIELARWLSGYYLTPLNACLRLMLPPGLTRWADVTLAINPRWDGSGALTELQQKLVTLLEQKGDLRGRQIDRQLTRKSNWRTAANQLARREILIRGSILDLPRVKPRKIRTASLSASPARIRDGAMQLGRASRKAELLYALLRASDPLPAEADILDATGARQTDLVALLEAGLVQRSPAATIVVPAVAPSDVPPELRGSLPRFPAPLESLADLPAIESLRESGFVRFVEQPAALGLSLPPKEIVRHIFRFRHGRRYLAILDLLAAAAAPVPVTELYEKSGASLRHLRKLASVDLISFGEEEVWRDPMADRDYVPSRAPELTEDQKEVWAEIRRSMEGPPGDAQGKAPSDVPGTQIVERSPILLHGVTGSGKTEIYMQAISLALVQGKRAVVLVPEIALTPQTLRRFAARFPGQVAVLHSRLSDGERYDTWRRARSDQIDIVVGPRSALFAPLDQLGVVIVDEEHDNSYKQTPPVPAPYYHARDAAIALTKILDCTVILGSATPDLVSYHKARAGRLKLLELPRRIMGHRQRIASQIARYQRESRFLRAEEDPGDAMSIPLPPVQLVDLRQELRAGNRSIFSRALQQAMDATLARGEQAILFLNRRGTATFVFCRDCGLVLSCPRCDSPLTYHRPDALLACHYCGRKEAPHQTCPRCGSSRIKQFGLGTEEVERRVRGRWPSARTIRWDRDTTAGKDSHETLLASFINQEADILVGTQMIAKGLDLPLVTLVGVISADVTLGLPDYRTGERTFQILAQVAGRAGRGLLGGQVVVQTYQPGHYAIQAASEHDFTSFYLEEIRFRTQHSLPPFRRLAKLVVADPVSGRAERQARKLAKALRLRIRELELSATELVGPVPPFFSRLEGRYRWQILVRSPDPTRLLDGFDLPRNWVLDIDPVSNL